MKVKNTNLSSSSYISSSSSPDTNPPPPFSSKLQNPPTLYTPICHSFIHQTEAIYVEVFFQNDRNAGGDDGNVGERYRRGKKDNETGDDGSRDLRRGGGIDGGSQMGFTKLPGYTVDCQNGNINNKSNNNNINKNNNNNNKKDITNNEENEIGCVRNNNNNNNVEKNNNKENNNNKKNNNNKNNKNIENNNNNILNNKSKTTKSVWFKEDELRRRCIRNKLYGEERGTEKAFKKLCFKVRKSKNIKRGYWWLFNFSII